MPSPYCTIPHTNPDWYMRLNVRASFPPTCRRIRSAPFALSDRSCPSPRCFGKIGPPKLMHNASNHWQRSARERSEHYPNPIRLSPVQITSIWIAAPRVISRIQAPSGQAPSLAPHAIALWEIAGGSERLGMTKPGASHGYGLEQLEQSCIARQAVDLGGISARRSPH